MIHDPTAPDSPVRQFLKKGGGPGPPCLEVPALDAVIPEAVRLSTKEIPRVVSAANLEELLRAHKVL